jgi:hypothetical protein
MLLHKQGDIFHPYGSDDIEEFSKLKENAIFLVDLGKSCTPKEVRTLQQNKMQFKWYRDMQKQGDQTAIEYRAYCKLHFGVPLLRVEDESFRAIYDKLIRPLDYEDKLSLMVEPIDLPVTSQMSVEIMAKYLKAVSDDATSKGMRLTGLEHLFEWLEQDK